MGLEIRLETAVDARQYRQTAITVALFGGSGVLLRTQQLQSSVAGNRQDTTAGLQGRTKP